MKNEKVFNIILEIIMIIAVATFMMPLYIVFINAFKTFNQVTTAPAAWPDPFTLGNFKQAWTEIDFITGFKNTFLITLFSTVGIVLSSAMASYRFVRSPGKVSNVLSFILLAGLLVPFQTLMIPVAVTAKELKLTNSIFGMTIIYVGFGVSLVSFLFRGFIKSGVPIELEESATIDGCGPIRLFFTIVLPLLKPITITAVILQILWIWNDYLLPLIMLSEAKKLTLVLSYHHYFGQYLKHWELAMASVFICIIPIIIFYLFCQKYIIQGLTAGALKG